MNLNARAMALCQAIEEDAELLRVAVSQVGATRVFDFGLHAAGGFEAGLRMAGVCLAGLGHVSLRTGDPAVANGPAVVVRTDHPLAACMASQYAGWEISGNRFFAMGSGPFRAAAAREELFRQPPMAAFVESAPESGCVGVLEASELPEEEVCHAIAERCGVSPEQLTLLVAPTTSQAGVLQVVARSVETAMHKLHELGFDLTRIESAWGAAPLPPVANDATTGIGRTNDAILYGGQVVLYTRGDDATLEQVGPRIPSIFSEDYGRPFREVFQSYGGDFYKIDKHLFSPAVVTLVNLDTGTTARYGRYAPALLAKSFGQADASC